jgi:hypothetical protein
LGIFHQEYIFSGDSAGTHLTSDFTQTGGHGVGGLEGVTTAHLPHTLYTWQAAQLPNGIYALSAWVRSSGRQSTAWIVAKHYGGAEKDANIPAHSTYMQVTIPNIQVTNGQVEVGFYSIAGAGQGVAFDDVTLQ